MKQSRHISCQMNVTRKSPPRPIHVRIREWFWSVENMAVYFNSQLILYDLYRHKNNIIPHTEWFYAAIVHVYRNEINSLSANELSEWLVSILSVWRFLQRYRFSPFKHVQHSSRRCDTFCFLKLTRIRYNFLEASCPSHHRLNTEKSRIIWRKLRTQKVLNIVSAFWTRN